MMGGEDSFPRRDGDMLVVSNSCVVFLGAAAAESAGAKPTDFRRMGTKMQRGSKPNSRPHDLEVKLRAALRRLGDLRPIEEVALDPGPSVKAEALGHLFLVTPLGTEAIRGVAAAAELIFQGTRKLDDGLALPDATRVMKAVPTGGGGQQQKNMRVEAILCLNEVLRAPRRSSVFAYSAADDAVTIIRRDLVLNEGASSYKNLAADGLRAAIAAKALTTGCFWCGTAPVAAPPKVCARCATVRYCSRKCQLEDWKAFHRGAECKGFAAAKAKGTTEPNEGNNAPGPTLTMGASRDAVLRHPEVVTPRLPFEITLPDWDGDQLCVYIYNLDDDGSIGPDTTPCPLGWHLCPKERWAFEKMKFSYAPPASTDDDKHDKDQPTAAAAASSSPSS